MAIAAATMNNNNNNIKENDMVMPGFRFHPTEEELVEFYLRRMVEGKRFNVELITSLDLYRFDPWELPALATIGEKEWFFYVPRVQKYRSGDRPNRVTTSGYWKATGADKMIRSENSRSIGSKKTLVFYSGKAPKGIRTNWIMNEYRLPQHETERYQKTEISLCRVYTRAGVEDHPSILHYLPSTRASSSRSVSSASIRQSDKNKLYSRHHQEAAAHRHFAIERFQDFGGGQSSCQTTMSAEKMSPNADQTDGSSSCSDVTTVLGLPEPIVYRPNMAAISTLLGLPSSLMEDEARIFLNQSKQSATAAAAAAVAYSSSSLVPNCTATLVPAPAAAALSSSSSAVSSNAAAFEFQGLLTYQQASMNQQQQCHIDRHHHQHLQFSTLQAQSQPPLGLRTLPVTFSDRLWEWNPIPEVNSREYNDPFK